MNLNKIASVTSVVALLLGVLAPFNNLVAAASGDALWARTTTTNPNSSTFAQNVTDDDGNIYVVGNMTGTGEYDFGNDVKVTGSFDGYNSLVVKYNSSGIAQWARSTVTASSATDLTDIAIDNSGDIFVVGSISGIGEADFGNDIVVQSLIADPIGILLKYSPDGTPQWISLPAETPGGMTYGGVDVDIAGNVYISGDIYGGGSFDFGNDVIVSGGTSDGTNALIVKYNNAGVAQWARSTIVSTSYSSFFKVKVDTAGNTYLVGAINGTDPYTFGDDFMVTGVYFAGNPIVFKYNAQGTPVWATIMDSIPGEAFFSDLDIGGDGSIVVTGWINGNEEYSLGNAVTVSGTSLSANLLVAKYNSSGLAQWARSTITSDETSQTGFDGTDIDIDSSGNIYTSGTFLCEATSCGFGNDVFLEAGPEGALIVKYDASGNAQWAKSVTEATTGVASQFFGVSVDNAGDIIASGILYSSGYYDFGNGAAVTSEGEYSIILVKYAGTSPPTFSTLPGDDRQININEGETITTNPFTIRVRPIDDSGIARVEFYVDGILIGTDTTADGDGVYSMDWDTSMYYPDVRVVAYDTDGNSVTINRSATVRLASVTLLPRTGSNLGSAYLIYSFLTLVTLSYIYMNSRTVKRVRKNAKINIR